MRLPLEENLRKFEQIVRFAARRHYHTLLIGFIDASREAIGHIIDIPREQARDRSYYRSS